MNQDDGIKPPDAGKTSVRFGPATLRPAKEKGHYELMRTILTTRNEGDRLVKEQHTEPVGPLAIYRVKRRGDKVDMSRHNYDGPPAEMRTTGPDGQPLSLILYWWPGMD